MLANVSGRLALALLLGFVLAGWTASRAAAAFPGTNGKIAFVSTRDGGDEDVFVMGADGSSPTNLTAGIGAADHLPAWSADGTRITFGSGRNWAPGDVFTMAADGSSPLNLRRAATTPRTLAMTTGPASRRMAPSSSLKATATTSPAISSPWAPMARGGST